MTIAVFFFNDSKNVHSNSAIRTTKTEGCNLKTELFFTAIVGIIVQLLSCVQLCNPMDYSPRGSSVHGIFQTRILEWKKKKEYWNGLSFPSLEELSNPGIEPVSPALAGRFFTTEPPKKPLQCH